jgi:hypothetical protein
MKIYRRDSYWPKWHRRSLHNPTVAPTKPVVDLMAQWTLEIAKGVFTVTHDELSSPSGDYDVYARHPTMICELTFAPNGAPRMVDIASTRRREPWTTIRLHEMTVEVALHAVQQLKQLKSAPMTIVVCNQPGRIRVGAYAKISNLGGTLMGGRS